MFGPIRAVAIDDEPSHLLGITTGLTAIGIPCIGYWWDRTVNELRPAPQAGGIPFLRLIFMDLNLAEQGGVPDAANLAAVVMTVLKQIVSPNGGPYLLVFWTQVGTRVQEVSSLIYERLEGVEGVPAPVAITELPKKPFLVNDSAQGGLSDSLKEFYTALYGNIDALKKAVQGTIEYDPTLCALSSWESRAAEAAAGGVFALPRVGGADVAQAGGAGAGADGVADRLPVASGDEGVRADVGDDVHRRVRGAGADAGRE